MDWVQTVMLSKSIEEPAVARVHWGVENGVGSLAKSVFVDQRYPLSTSLYDAAAVSL